MKPGQYQAGFLFVFIVQILLTCCTIRISINQFPLELKVKIA